MCRTMSMFWVIYKWQIVLICISYIGFGKSTGWYYKDTSRASTTSKFEYCKKKKKLKKKKMKYRLFLIHFFLYLDRIGDSVKIWEDTDTILSIYRKIQIRGSLCLGIFHTVEFFVILVNTWQLVTNVTKNSC